MEPQASKDRAGLSVGRFGAGGAMLVLLIVVTAGVGAYSTWRLYETEQQVRQSHELSLGFQRMLALSADAETGQRGFLVTGDETYLEPFHAARAALETQAARIESLTPAKSVQAALFSQLRGVLREKQAEMDLTIRLRREQGFEAAREVVATGRGKRQMDTARQLIAQMEALTEQEQHMREGVARQSRDLGAAMAAGAGLLSLLMLAGFGWVTARFMLQQMRSNAELHTQKEEFRITLASIGDGVITTDAQGRVTFINQVAQALCGWSAAEAAGQPLQEVFRIIHESTREPVDNPALRALREGVITGLANHTLLITRDGRETPIDDSGAPIFDAQSRISGSVLVFRDFTERKRSDDAQALLANIVSSADDAIISKTLAGEITSWNGAAERMFGYTAAEVIGRPITLILPPDRLAEEAQILARIGAGDRVDHVETVRMARDGSLLDVSLTISPLRDRYGRLVGASKVVRDISDRRRLVETMRQAERRKDEFLATLAHELRNPLAPLRNALHVALRPDFSAAESAHLYSMMARQVELLVRLVDDLLDVARITQGKIELRLERIDLGAVLRHALETCAPILAQGHHHVDIHQPAGPVLVAGDLLRLAQVVGNLLSNAAKYSDPGRQITLSVSRHGEEAFIAVRDQGIGIPAEMLDRIFEMFSQVDRSLERSKSGLGIGLTLARQIVALHGGEIRAYSKGLGQGSEFVVRLPVLTPETGAPIAGAAEPGSGAGDVGARSTVTPASADLERSALTITAPGAAAPDAAAQSATLALSFSRHSPVPVSMPASDPGFAPAEAAAAAPAASTGSAIRILIADDNRDAAESLGMILEMEGFDVHLAFDGQEAVTTAANLQPQVVVLDIGMPVLNGYEAARHIRAQAGAGAPFLIAVTGWGQEEDRKRSSEAGFDRHLLKPVDADTLIKLLAGIELAAPRS